MRFARAILISIWAGCSLNLAAQDLPAAPVAAKAPWVAHLLRRHAESLRIKDLKLPSEKIPVVLIPKAGALKPLVDIKVEFAREGWQLFAPNGQPMKRAGESNEYSVLAYLLGKVSEVTILARGPGGAQEYETIYIYAPEAQQFKVGSNWRDLSILFGFGTLAYQQASYGLYESLVGSLGLQYQTPTFFNRYGLIASGDLTILTFKSSPINSGPQILEGKVDGYINLDAAPEARTRFQLLLGADYLTMFANGSPFGFSNLLAPEAGLRAVYVMDPITSLIGEGRYVAIGRFHGEAQFGVDVGLTWVRQLPDSHRFRINVSFASYTYAPAPEEKVAIDMAILRLGYTL